MKHPFVLIGIVVLLVVVRLANPSPITQSYDPLIFGVGLLSVAVLVVMEAAKESSKLQAFGNQLIDILTPSYVFFLLLYLMINLIVFPARVNGTSMLPTFQSGDIVLFYMPGSVERFDVVFVHITSERTTHFTDEFMLKRVIGLPGDELNIVNGQLILNGTAVTEEYINGPMLATGLSCFSPTNCRQVPENMVFVMGDNRNSSIDSRSYGLVPIEDVVGRVVFNVREVLS